MSSDNGWRLLRALWGGDSGALAADLFLDPDSPYARAVRRLVKMHGVGGLDRLTWSDLAEALNGALYGGENGEAHHG